MSKTIVLGLALALVTAFAACGSDEPEKNPNFMTGSGGSAGSSGGGSGGSSVSDGGSVADGGAVSDGGDGSGGSGGSTGSGGSAGSGGSGGGFGYDCVTNPTTHLEIINACTDAERIEKHPELPPLPQ